MDHSKLRIGQKVRVLEIETDSRKNKDTGEIEKFTVRRRGEIVTITTVFSDSIQVFSDKSKTHTYFYNGIGYELLAQDLAEGTKAAMFGAFRAQGFHVEEIIRLAQAGIV